MEKKQRSISSSSECDSSSEPESDERGNSIPSHVKVRKTKVKALQQSVSRPPNKHKTYKVETSESDSEDSKSPKVPNAANRGKKMIAKTIHNKVESSEEPDVPYPKTYGGQLKSVRKISNREESKRSEDIVRTVSSQEVDTFNDASDSESSDFGSDNDKNAEDNLITISIEISHEHFINKIEEALCKQLSESDNMMLDSQISNSVSKVSQDKEFWDNPYYIDRSKLPSTLQIVFSKDYFKKNKKAINQVESDFECNYTKSLEVSQEVIAYIQSEINEIRKSRNGFQKNMSTIETMEDDDLPKEYRNFKKTMLHLFSDKSDIKDIIDVIFPKECNGGSDDETIEILGINKDNVKKLVRALKGISKKEAEMLVKHIQLSELVRIKCCNIKKQKFKHESLTSEKLANMLPNYNGFLKSLEKKYNKKGFEIKLK